MTRVLLFSHDVVGERMAGPAIRYWELAHQLAAGYEVTLAVPGRPVDRGQPFRLVGYDRASYGALFAGQDVCLTQLVSPRMLPAARRHGTRLIADLYDPMLLEELELHQDKSLRRQRARNRRTLARTRLTLAAADAFICATDRQRDLWLGALLASDRLRPDCYRDDPTLQRLIALVPFGLPGEEPRRTGAGPRQVFGIPAAAVVLLWGGGVWNWFDPLTLLEALHQALDVRDDLHLIFLGLQHPNPRILATAMAGRLLERAEELRLLGRHVHVNHGWVPYADRANYLLDADVGVSLHAAHLETRFAFRTRFLDYLWAGLPILCSEGDHLADLVAAEGLGAVIPVGAVSAAREAILALSARDERYEAARANIGRLRPRFRWQAVAQPLREMIEQVTSRPAVGALPGAAVAAVYRETAREVVVDRRVGDAVRVLCRRWRR